MMKTITPLLLGLAIGVAATLLSRPSPAPARTPLERAAKEAPAKDVLAQEVDALRKENWDLRKKLDEAEQKVKAIPASPAAPTTPPTKEEEVATLAALFAEVSKEEGLSRRGDKARSLVDLVKKLGKGAVPFLTKMLLESKDSGERFQAAWLLEELKDPAGVPALAQALKSDSDLLVRRMTSHALAMIGSAEGKTSLIDAMNGDKDWGVRANSAYGVAKLGDDAGLQALVLFYESEDPAVAPYKMSILGGIADVAAPSTAPLFRELLQEEDLAGQLMAVHAVQKMKDKESLPLLATLIQSDASDTVKEAAKKAYNEISGEQIYK